jgi:mannose/fructose/N-acetylgalactosamine-specific phosphotransferase system component IID
MAKVAQVKHLLQKLLPSIVSLIFIVLMAQLLK